MADFKYDVAFSFLEPDERSVFAVSDLVSDRLTTFIYTEQQKDLIATDGIESFSQAYAMDSRTVVVLYRPRWGSTRWTKVEETAIKARGFREGWDFLLMVPLTPAHKLPDWYPPHFIYFDFSRWGVEGLAPVIESHVLRAGGAPRVETLEQRMRRLLQQEARAAKKSSFMFSAEGLASARAEFENVVSLVTKAAERVAVTGVQLGVRRTVYGGNPMAIVDGSGLSASIVQEVSPMQPLEKSEVNLTLWKSFAPFGVEFAARPKCLGTEQYRFDVDDARSPRWRVLKAKSVHDWISSSALAERTISIIVDKVEADMKTRDRDRLPGGDTNAHS